MHQSEIDKIIALSIQESLPYVLLSDPQREIKIRQKLFRDLSLEGIRGLSRFLQCIAVQDKRSLETIVNNLKQSGSLKIFSAACFHANWNRRGLVDGFSPTISELIVRTADLALSGLPVEYWNFYTFGPGDWDFLSDWQVTETVLPYMHELSSSDRDAEFSRQFELTADLISKLNQVLPFEVRLYPINDLSNYVKREEVIEEAKKRAEQIFLKLKKSPPEIFSYLPDDQSKIVRCQKEATLYLAFTKAFGSSNMLYVGKEVHGGYWKAGKLNFWDNNFLPLSWVHPAISQHWGPWSEEAKGYRILEYKEFLENCHFV